MPKDERLRFAWKKIYSRFSEVSRGEGRNNGVTSGQWRNILLELKFYDKTFHSLTMAICRPFYSKRHLEKLILSTDLTLTATYFKTLIPNKSTLTKKE